MYGAPEILDANVAHKSEWSSTLTAPMLRLKKFSRPESYGLTARAQPPDSTRRSSQVNVLQPFYKAAPESLEEKVSTNREACRKAVVRRAYAG